MAEPIFTIEDMKAGAEAQGEYAARCVQGEVVFFWADTESRMPGHIYSEDGVNEFRISQCCEYHFDAWFKDPDEE